MNEMMIKLFKKKEAIKVYYVGLDKKVKVIWTLPKENKVQFGELLFDIIPEKIFIHNGVSCMFVNSFNAEPIDINKIDFHVKTPEDYEDAIGTKVLTDFMNANKKKESFNLAVVLSVLSIGIAAYIAYSMSNEFKVILEQLAEITRLLGGGGIE